MILRKESVLVVKMLQWAGALLEAWALHGLEFAARVENALGRAGYPSMF